MSFFPPPVPAVRTLWRTIPFPFFAAGVGIGSNQFQVRFVRDVDAPFPPPLPYYIVPLISAEPAAHDQWLLRKSGASFPTNPQ